jgi:hypothetical protein
MRFDVLDTDDVDERWSTGLSVRTPAPAPRRYRFTPPPIRTRKVSQQGRTSAWLAAWRW